MLTARPHSFTARALFALAFCAFAALLGPGPRMANAQESREILPLNQVRPGMQGYAYTIFAGDQVEKFDLEVLGVLDNFLGPKQSIILVQLKGPKVEHTGVVAGMSGSPVYLEGRLAGALSLKLGVFTKEPIAGVTPIEDILSPPSENAAARPSTQQFGLPSESAARTGIPSGSALEPIETPLVFSGFQPAAIQQFANQLQGYGLVAAQGGTAKPRPDDAHLAAGDMAGMVLVQGDASINSACTVTAVQADRVYLCGHPFLSLGNVQLPMARSRVVTTLSSDLASTKIVNVGGSIGTITGDHLTAVTGKLGAPPAMVPLDLTLVTAEAGSPKQKTLHFEIVNHPKLTPLLVAITTFSGLTQNSLYGEGTTLHLSGEIRLQGHNPVQIENTFAPGDSLSPDGLPIALTMQSVFTRLFSNSFEPARVDRISLRVESVPGRKSFTIASAAMIASMSDSSFLPPLFSGVTRNFPTFRSPKSTSLTAAPSPAASRFSANPCRANLPSCWGAPSPASSLSISKSGEYFYDLCAQTPTEFHCVRRPCTPRFLLLATSFPPYFVVSSRRAHPSLAPIHL